MKVDGTSLEYNESEGVCLDYYLGDHHETKDKWAQRVWNFCKEYQDTNGDGYPPAGESFFTGRNERLYLKKKMPSVYKQDASVLWEAKKRRRRACMVKEFTNHSCDASLLCMENIEKDVKNQVSAVWIDELSDAKVLELKKDSKYVTASQRYKEKEAAHAEKLAARRLEVSGQVTKLKEKFDDETIAIIFPKGKRYLTN